VTTLKEFEDALREQGMHMALAVLERLRQRDRAKRTIAPARRVTGRKMTPELARSILELHATTNMTQQEIAFKLGVNQGRVNEVIKRGKWLTDDPAAPEARARDRALERMRKGASVERSTPTEPNMRVQRTEPPNSGGKRRAKAAISDQGQLLLGDF